MGESSEGSDGFVSEVLVGGGIVGASSSGSFSDSVDFFVHFGSVVVTELTSSGN